MIQIDKAELTDAPESFKKNGKKWTERHCEFFDNNKDKCSSGSVPLQRIREHLYQDETVKSKLNESHHSKCCYCETKFSYLDYLDVEHFRPKNGAQQWRDTAEIACLYFWLAYDWDNLFLSCGPCNRNYKGNLFPLGNEASRANAVDRNIDNEDFMFIKPTENGRAHIRFSEETPYFLTPRGDKTIDGIGLRRPELFESRREHLERIRKWLKDLDTWQRCSKVVKRINDAELDQVMPQIEEEGIKALLQLSVSTKVEAPFSSMTRDFLEVVRFQNPEFA